MVVVTATMVVVVVELAVIGMQVVKNMKAIEQVVMMATVSVRPKNLYVFLTHRGLRV